MGSCYSCKSNGGPQTYTTVAMATADPPLPTAAAAMVKTDARRPPYSRGSSGSFGFRKRTPATLKSQTQDRTSELVNIYETKIAGHSNKITATVKSGTNSPAALRRAALSGHVKIQPTNSSSSSPSSSTTNVAVPNANYRQGFAYHKTIPRGVVHMQASSSSSTNTITSAKSSDGNCNDVNATNLSPSKTVPSNRQNSAMGSPNRVSKTGRENYHSDHHHQRVGPPSKTGGAPRYIEDYENGNHHHHLQQQQHQHRNFHDKAETCARPAIKVKTLLGGLPKPQVPILVSKGTVGVSQRIEAMDISAETIGIGEDDNLLFDADSGLGNSVSDQRRSEGDTETLAEVDQIEGDAASLCSRQDPQDSLLPNHQVAVEPKRGVTEPPPVQRAAKTGIARLRSALPTASSTAKVVERRASPVLVNKVPKNGPSVSSHPIIGLRKKGQTTATVAPVSDHATIAVVKLASSPKRVGASKVAHKETRIGAGHLLSGRKDFAGSSGSEEWKIVVETRQKENVTPDVLDDEIIVTKPTVDKKLASNDKGNGGHKNAGPVAVATKMDKAPLPVVSHHRDTDVELSLRLQHQPQLNSNVMVTSDDSNESSLRDLGPYSPPSEKDFFLIDDEICDQPALIACQSLDEAAAAYHGSQRDLRRANDASVIADGSDEGLTIVVNQKCINIPNQRQMSHYENTLSPTSSIGSDDLMCDYDCSDDAFLDGFANRTSGDAYDDGGQLDFVDADPRYQQSPRSMQQRSPAVGSILQEWNGLKGSHGFDGRSPVGHKPKYRSQRLDSNGIGSPSVSDQFDMPAGAGTSSPAASASAGGSSTRRTAISFRPPKQMSVTDGGDGCAKVDASSYRYMCQDLTSMKTMLLKLKRSLQESDDVPADTLNPFEMSNLKNGLFLNLANSDPPDSILPDRNLHNVIDEPAAGLIEQENADLRRQVIFFQEQLEERDRTIRLLQQQLAKLTIPNEDSEAREKCNAACQTERQRTVLGNSLPPSVDENSFGSTVSCQSRK